MRMMTLGRTALAVSFLAAAGPVALAQEAPAPRVLVQTVAAESFRPSFTHPARIEAFQIAKVRPVVSAQVVAVHGRAGDVVKAGQLLVELDDTNFQIALAQAKANVLKAEAAETKAQADFERAEQLVNRGTVSERDLDFARASRDIAVAEVQLAKAVVEKAEEDLADTKIYAPFDGRLSKSNYAVGDLFQIGDPTQPSNIYTIVQLNPIYAIARIDQADYFNYITRRLRLEEDGISIPPLEVHLLLPDGREYPHEGLFENWDNTAEASSGTVVGRIVFPNPDGHLLPGGNVTIRGRVIEPVEAVMVPQRAVSFDQQGHFLMIVGADGLVERRNVVMGVRNGPDWAVRSGLEAGEIVIVEGLQKARVGMPVDAQDYQG